MKKDRKGEVRFILEPKYDKGELTREILRGLGVGGVLLMSLAAPNLAQLLKFFEPADRIKVRKVLDNLKKRRLIEVYEKDDKDYFEVTEAGRRRILEFDVEDMVLNTKRRWDGVWRGVVFDIPEMFKPARMALQQKLRELEFYPYQKSVYLTPYYCRDEIEFLSRFFAVERHVKYLEINHIDDELKLINHFELG